MADFKYNILADLGAIEEIGSFETKVKVISWNGKDAKLDIRKWNEEDNVMGKGISISLASIKKLKEILNNIEDNYENPNDTIDM